MTENDELLDVAVQTAPSIEDFGYPMEFSFKIGTLANDFIAKDSSGKTVAYVRQKMFKLKEAVSVYKDDSKSELMFKINADRWIDYNASYNFTIGESEDSIGRVGRRGRKSLWKAHYEIFDTDGDLQYSIREENPWAKVWDAVLGEIPVMNLFTGYLANPRYIVKNLEDQDILRLSKKPSFFGRHFKLDKIGEVSQAESERILLSLMMMSLLERRRG